MSAREDLAEVIRDGVGVWRTPLEAADAIQAAGFGKLADAWDEGYMRGQFPWKKEAQEVDPLPDYLSPPSRGRNTNPYRSAS